MKSLLLFNRTPQTYGTPYGHYYDMTSKYDR